VRQLALNVLVLFEESGRVRDEFIKRGHNALSVDLKPSRGMTLGQHFPSLYPAGHQLHDVQRHYQGDVRDIFNPRITHTMALEGQEVVWDLLIAHPECTRLANSGVRWLTRPPRGKTLRQLWQQFDEAVAMYQWLRGLPIRCKAIENPVMHRHARARLGYMDGEYTRQVVQPWWFGETAFKATGFELHQLPELVATHKLTPPKAGTDEHKRWSWVHRCPPGPRRAQLRSTTFRGIAEAMAEQWGGVTWK
jgi:hypothetical protein